MRTRVAVMSSSTGPLNWTTSCSPRRTTSQADRGERGQRSPGPQDAPRARHAQVRVDDEPALEAQEQVLADRLDELDAAAGEALGPAVAAEARVRRLDRVGDVAGEHGADAQRRVVERVALRHRRR